LRKIKNVGPVFALNRNEFCIINFYKEKSMKKQNVFMALFLATFMLLLFGSVSSADPMMAPAGGPNDHHGVDCAALPTPGEVVACENGPHHEPNMAPPDLVGVGPGAPVEGPMYGGPNDPHLQAPVNMDGGHDCAGLPTPEEVAACWDTKNQAANDHHVEIADPQHHPPAIPAGACPPDCGHDPNMAPPGLVGVGSGAPVEGPMYGGPNDHHLQAPVGMDGGHDCAGLPTPEEVAACWDTKNQHANDHHVETADPGHHPPGMP
jgi:hypothetical protein